jgi:hypothetical protein
MEIGNSVPRTVIVEHLRMITSFIMRNNRPPELGAFNELCASSTSLADRHRSFVISFNSSDSQ